MRLEKIKLAGFKSFVDPTTIPLPGNLVGVVGPNGCGKSNVIDAVRWVMGESSAKHLRGDSMTDVIFNGSSTRKPVGLASVELTFDNSDSRVGGEMGRYQQISIRRQVSRDAQSAYFLNGTRCRRKDITDLFLGTGLGSRSYAIIEQGTISRLVEAKPMELREIIEEAAGISRYKERRHETELRIGHTRENLERLTDLRDEVAKQVQSLQRQAKKAEKYAALKADEQRYRQQLLGLRWRKYDQQFQAGCAVLEECEQQFRARREQGATLEAELTAARQNLDDLQDQLNERQARFYELSAEVSRLDQAIKHAKATRASLEQEQARLTEEQRQAQAALSNDEAQLDQQRRERADIEAQLAEANAAEGAAEERRALADAALRAARSEVDGMAAELHRLGARIDVQRTRLKQLEQQERQWEMRQERLETERDDLRETLASEAVESLREEEAELDAARSDLQRQLAQLNAEAQAARQQIRECQEELNRIRAEQHTAEGKISSLERLQEHAMGKDRAGLNKWLSARGLQQTSRLAEHLDVAPGWEAAVESVLGGRLQALCVADAGPFLADLGDISGESLSFFETRPTAPTASAATDKLLSRVSAPWQLGPLLGSVWCAEDRDSARQRSDSLAEHESVVTPDGLRFGSGWLAAERPDDGTSGVLARERELRDLKSRRDQLHERQAGLAEQLASAEQTLRRAEQDRERLQGEERKLAAEYSRVKSELSAAMARCEQATRRLRQVEAELDDVAEQRGNDREAADEARAILLEAEDLRADLEPRHAATLAERQRLDQELGDAESAVRDARDRCLGLRGKAESLAAADSLTSKHLDRARQQFQTAEERLAALAAQLAQAETPDDDRAAVLEELIEQRAEAEQSLAALRKSSEAGEAELRRLSEARLAAERGFDQVKQRLEETKLDLQGNEVRRQTVQEQFEELGADPAAAVASLPDDAEEKEWQNRLNGLVDEITKLGAVNLTALEECQAQEERLAFLEQQHLDLTESLDSLADAIDKIDKECRGRFKDTFDRINSGLQRMFPKLFGGGQASLDLTDRDLLESGVTITARPPGKRNSSIHLLSGGEKALTAVALVFAIFELNPAPFCLLDEVDAPLDDANVGRFSQLVKEMSEKVQFLFISHNKVTMEIAQHLAGVTMKEPGVSRIVAVDIDAAVELATA